MAKQFQERKSWLSTQRQSLGPDWTSRIHPDTLNREIERVVKDLYFGNIGITDINMNTDFADLCSFSVVSALYNYYVTKISNILPIYNAMEKWKNDRFNSVYSIGEEYRQAELQKINDEINNTPAFHFVAEVYAYYYNALKCLDDFIKSNFTELSCMDNLCRVVYKNSNKWGNPSVRFI